MTEKTRINLCPGVNLTHLYEKRFKNDFFTLTFLLPFNSNDNAVSGIIAPLLERGCIKYPSSRDIEAALEDAYDTDIFSDTTKSGNIRSITFSADWISDKYSEPSFCLKERVFDILSQIILCPLTDSNGLLKSDFLELERKAVMQLLDTEINDKRSYAVRRCLSELFGDDPFGKPKYGTREDVLSMTVKQVTSFYERMKHDFAIEFFYEGSLPPENVKELISAYFSPLINPKKITLQALEYYAPFTPCDYSELCEEQDCEQSTLTMGFSLPLSGKSRYALMLFKEIFSSSPASRLFMNVREKYGLCYTCYMITYPSKDAAIIVSGIEYKRKAEAITAILGEIDSVVKNGITEDELSFAKSSLKSGLLSINDNPQSRANWELTSIISESVESPDEAVEIIDGITEKQIIGIAKSMKLCNIFMLSGKN